MSELALGQKVRLNDGKNGNGTIRFIGHTGFAQGEWVGIELDDQTGKNDGSVQGQRYFDCPLGYGMFVRPMALTIVAQPPPKPATMKRASRPSSMLTTGPGAGRAGGPTDPGLAKRISLNAPSPSPVPKSRPSSLVRVSGLY